MWTHVTFGSWSSPSTVYIVGMDSLSSTVFLYLSGYLAGPVFSSFLKIKYNYLVNEQQECIWKVLIVYFQNLRVHFFPLSTLAQHGLSSGWIRWEQSPVTQTSMCSLCFSGAREYEHCHRIQLRNLTISEFTNSRGGSLALLQIHMRWVLCI